MTLFRPCQQSQCTLICESAELRDATGLSTSSLHGKVLRRCSVEPLVVDSGPIDAWFSQSKNFQRVFRPDATAETGFGVDPNLEVVHRTAIRVMIGRGALMSLSGGRSRLSQFTNADFSGLTNRRQRTTLIGATIVGLVHVWERYAAASRINLNRIVLEFLDDRRHHTNSVRRASARETSYESVVRCHEFSDPASERPTTRGHDKVDVWSSM